MKTIHELNDDIMKLTMKIRNHHPELMKYISEMPDGNTDKSDPEIDRKMLIGYYESLKSLLIKYGNNTPSTPH